jgi:hypothetical protein
MRGRDIVFLYLWYFVVVSRVFLSFKLLILTICYRMFLGGPHLEEG